MTILAEQNPAISRMESKPSQIRGGDRPGRAWGGSPASQNRRAAGVDFGRTISGEKSNGIKAIDQSDDPRHSAAS
jgi:hypothetical protein